MKLALVHCFVKGIILWIFSQRRLGLAGYGSFALPNTLRFDSCYQQESVGGHHIPKHVYSARGFNIALNTPIFFFSKKNSMDLYIYIYIYIYMPLPL